MSAQKKALQLASVASMIDQFIIPNIQVLQSLGYSVDVVADFTNPGTITAERCANLKKRLKDINVRVFDIPIPRSLNPASISSAYKQVKELLDKENYNLLHCHSPIGGVIARQAAKGLRSKGLKVIYTAHGFHFYDGAPLKNWLLFYPIEKYYSRYTDVLITINKEDYGRAKEHFKAKKVVYIPGVGVDTEKFAICNIDKTVKRAELGVKESDFLLLSVDDLSERKNQSIVIEAIHKMKDEGRVDNIVYLVVGKGEQEEEFRQLISEYGLEKHINLLGFRTDIDELCEIADCFVHPSIREGLGIAPLEAMAAGLPLISANVNGIKDYTEDGVSGCCIDPIDVDEMVKAIKRMHDDEAFRTSCASNNFKTAKTFDIRNTDEIMSEVYRGGYRHLLSIVVRQEKRDELGIPIEAFLLLSVGELSERKNHKVIVDSLQSLPSNYWYVIVGKGELEEELECSDKTGRLILAGYRNDIKELLWASDLLVFPSKQEGLPVALMEAMAAGLPVVASKIRGNIDLIQDGKEGYLYDPHDASGFADGITIIINSDYRKMGLVNTQAIRHFDVNYVRQLMKIIYERI